jgi:hypothetical protein
VIQVKPKMSAAVELKRKVQQQRITQTNFSRLVSWLLPWLAAFVRRPTVFATMLFSY